jgi:Xaa-Pro aminopeptidase
MRYKERRARLHRMLGADDGILFWPGYAPQPRNYPDNTYTPFRQCSHFLYYFGLSTPGLAALSYPDGREFLFGRTPDEEDLVWTGPQPSLAQLAEEAQVSETARLSKLRDYLETAGWAVRYLPPFQPQIIQMMGRLFDRSYWEVIAQASPPMMRAVVEQRSIKTEEEIAQIEDALTISLKMAQAMLEQVAPGKTEAEIAAAMKAVALAQGRDQAFPPIVTVHGEILHNESYSHTLQEGQLLLCDYGAESPLYYASDITRTAPVSGTFSTQQREIYEIVLAAQSGAIEQIKPERPYREIHLEASRIIASGLKDLGLMQGDVEEAVQAGAHALFFPHGLGHMLGLDVHDMEDLGDIVGYSEEENRSEQFGLSFLRLAQPLRAGYVLTVEPGIYFVPGLIERWQQDQKHAEFICYDRLDAYSDFGGIRLEDDVLVTAEGGRVLGPGIPKEPAEIEQTIQSLRS